MSGPKRSVESGLYLVPSLCGSVAYRAIGSNTNPLAPFRGAVRSPTHHVWSVDRAGVVGQTHEVAGFPSVVLRGERRSVTLVNVEFRPACGTGVAILQFGQSVDSRHGSLACPQCGGCVTRTTALAPPFPHWQALSDSRPSE